MNSQYTFLDFVRQFVTLTRDEERLLLSSVTLRDVPKNKTLVSFGDIASEVYFINSGCMRYYYITDEGSEVTGFIYEEGMFAGTIESFFTQSPSNQYLETVTDCELLVLNHETLEELYRKIPAMNELVRKVFMQRMIFAQKLIASLIMLKPEDRYRKYQELHPGIENRISQNKLATYLGITPVSLSRIRGRK